jgi:hypothetical protein
VDALENISCTCRESKHSSSDDNKPVAQSLHRLRYPGFSPNIIRVTKSRRMTLVRHVARIGEKRNSYSVFVGKPKGKRPFTRPRRKWNNNIKKYVNEIRGGLDLSGSQYGAAGRPS